MRVVSGAPLSPKKQHSRPAGSGLALCSAAIMGACLLGGIISIASGMITRGASGAASMVWLPPGIALASVLIYGRCSWIGVWLGSLVPYALIVFGDSPQASLSTHIALTLVISSASAAQAILIGELVLRFADRSLRLERASTILRFLGCAALGSLPSSSIGSIACVLLGTRSVSTLATDWTSWWVSDTVSTFLVTPVLLSWWAKPAALWRPRRLQLTLPLGIAVLLSSLAFVQANHLEVERVQQDLSLHMDRLETGLREKVTQATEAVSVMQDAFDQRSRLSLTDLGRFAAQLRARNPGITEIAWVPRVLRSRREEYESMRRTDTDPGFEIRELSPAGLPIRAGERELYYPMHLLSGSQETLLLSGVDFGSIAQRLALLELADRRDQLTLSPPLQLVGVAGQRSGVLIAAPVRAEGGELEGLLICALRMHVLVSQVLPPSEAAELAVRIRDSAAPGAQWDLFDNHSKSQLDRARLEYVERRELRSAGRVWQLEAAPTEAFMRLHRPWLTRSVSGMGFCLAALLCGFLLVATGRAASVRKLVRARTRQLSQANALLREEIELQRRMDRALKESEALWQFAVEEAGDGAWDWNMEQKRLFWSERLASVLGYSADELDEGVDKWRSNIHPDDAARVEGALQRHLRGETRGFTAELRMRRKDGNWIWVATHAKVVGRSVDGTPLRVIGTMTDIRERKRTEEELREYRGQLEQLVQERTTQLEHAKAAAERANLAKTLFLANMSHELRTPMHAILAYARLGLDRDPSEKLKKFLTRIVVSAERLALLLNDLLDLSKLEAGKMKLDVTPLDLETLVRDTGTELEPLLQSKRLTLEIARAPGLANSTALVDRQRMAQLFHNILANAVRFSAEGGRIAVTFERAELPPAGSELVSRAALRVNISDEGVGIPPDELEHIFDSFVQSSKTRTNAGGTGLGLAICRQIANLHGGPGWGRAICRQIANLHGGTVYARNNPERGATFVLTLPLPLEPILPVASVKPRPALSA